MTTTRRTFVQMVMALWAGGAQLMDRSLHRLVPNRQEQFAVDRGRQLGSGSVSLEGPERVEADTFQTWTLVYTAGPAGVAPGGGLRVGLRHLQQVHAELPQTRDPRGSGYLTVATPGGLPAEVSVPRSSQLTAQYFAWQNLVQVTVGPPGLQAGERLQLTFGDRSQGGPGWRVQPFDETHYGFKCFVDVSGKGAYLPLDNSPTVEIVAAGPAKLTVLVPSQAAVDAPCWCLIRAEDRYGNPATDYRGTVRLSGTDAVAKLSGEFTFTAADRGVRRLENLRCVTPGIHTISVTDGARTGVSNPLRISREPPPQCVFWGDLHTHTLQSDGRGTVEQAYDFARRVAGLDFAAVSDHAFEILDEMWELNKRVTRRCNEPGRFVTFNAYEWSGTTPIGGDHNVYFLGDDPPLFRSSLMYDAGNFQMDHDTPKVDHVTELFTLLRSHCEPGSVFCIPHWGGRPGNPQWHDPQVQRLIEVFSEHRRSEAWAGTFLAAGHRVGIMASGDNHSGNPGYGCLKPTRNWDTQEIGMALVAVQAERLTRASVFRALYERRVYATSGARILLDFRVAGQAMGSDVRVDSAPPIVVEVVGTAPLTRIEVKRDNRIVHVREPGGVSARFTWTDPEFEAGRACYYYVRVAQDDGEEAISSPVWINPVVA